jgi:hypothetical protein
MAREYVKSLCSLSVERVTRVSDSPMVCSDLSPGDRAGTRMNARRPTVIKKGAVSQDERSRDAFQRERRLVSRATVDGPAG